MKSDVLRRRRRRGRHAASRARARWWRRRRRVIGLAMGFVIILAWSAPYFIQGWNSLVEQGTFHFFFSARDIESNAYKSGQRLAKRARGMSDTQLERTFDRYVEGLKVDIPPQQRAVDRKAFIRGYKGNKQ
ncbi:hypothetical protein MYX64_05590 [Nitrospinae bacterium AH_259_B05_G02_I21]|nr:hypothetical protein [Nitrospinae bacterium AH_259_B05_G02_I21]